MHAHIFLPGLVELPPIQTAAFSMVHSSGVSEFKPLSSEETGHFQQLNTFDPFASLLAQTISLAEFDI